MIKPAYTYQAHIKHVHDGDTVTCDIDLGMCIFVHDQKIRLLGLNAPELKKDAKLSDGLGEAARDYLALMIMNKDVIIETHKDSKEKYGRWLGVVWISKSGLDFNVNQDMLDTKHATVMRS